MNGVSHITDVARVIQLAVAPVFLLTALGTLLGVFSSRLARIVDRARVLADRLPGMPPERHDAVRGEMRLLFRRRRRMNAAIAFATAAALCVCILIATAFVGSLVGFDASHAIAGLFIAAMVMFIGALVTFLSEILLAVYSVAIER